MRQFRCNLKGHLIISKLAHASEKGHEISRTEAEILQLQANPIYRKNKAPANVPCSDKPLSQPCWEISPIWFPVICSEMEYRMELVTVLLYANCVVGCCLCQEMGPFQGCNIIFIMMHFLSIS